MNVFVIEVSGPLVKSHTMRGVFGADQILKALEDLKAQAPQDYECAYVLPSELNKLYQYGTHPMVYNSAPIYCVEAFLEMFDPATGTMREV